MKKVIVSILVVALLLVSYTPVFAQGRIIPRPGDCFWLHEQDFTGVVRVLAVDYSIEKPTITGWFLARPKFDGSEVFENAAFVSDYISVIFQPWYIGMVKETNLGYLPVSYMIEYSEYNLELVGQDVGFCPVVTPPGFTWGEIR